MHSAPRALIIAEVGINHNGDMDIAVKLIEAAKAAGADVVKFQNFKTEDFLTDHRLEYTYVSNGRTVTESQFDMFKRYELSDEQVIFLAEVCRKFGVGFASTPSNEDGVLLLKKLKADFVKNGSDALVHLPLIQEMARSGLPTVLSTGMSTLDDIETAVDVFRGAGGAELSLLQCTSVYPTNPEDVHLRKMQTLARTFNCPVGLSDHTEGIVAAIGAVALGAQLIEKHYTLDKRLDGPDHSFSMDPKELSELVAAVRTLEKQLGFSEIEYTQAEHESRRQYRFSCVARHELSKGHILHESDVAFKRPGYGIPPKQLLSIVGKSLLFDIAKGEPLQFEHFAEVSA